MKVTFHQHARRDLRWFDYYYSHKFPEGRKTAERGLKATLTLLKNNPRMGHPADNTSARLMPVRKTPFVLIYLIKGDTIDILRVWDARADPESMFKT